MARKPQRQGVSGDPRRAGLKTAPQLSLWGKFISQVWGQAIVLLILFCGALAASFYGFAVLLSPEDDRGWTTVSLAALMTSAAVVFFSTYLVEVLARRGAKQGKKKRGARRSASTTYKRAMVYTFAFCLVVTLMAAFSEGINSDPAPNIGSPVGTEK